MYNHVMEQMMRVPTFLGEGQLLILVKANAYAVTPGHSRTSCRVQAERISRCVGEQCGTTGRTIDMEDDLGETVNLWNDPRFIQVKLKLISRLMDWLVRQDLRVIPDASEGRSK